MLPALHGNTHSVSSKKYIAKLFAFPQSLAFSLYNIFFYLFKREKEKKIEVFLLSSIL